MATKIKFGYVSISGKPNVGKSTLLNAIGKRKVAITSPKPQTTRNQIKLVHEDRDSKIIFIDTPGYHDARNKLDIFLNSQIKSSYKAANITLFLVDMTREIDDEDKRLIEITQDYKIQNLIIVLTKRDLVSEKTVKKFTDLISPLVAHKEIITISNKNEETIDQLIKLIKKYLHEEEAFSDAVVESDDFMISELVREQVIFNCRQELPYSTSVLVEGKTYDKVKNLLEINATIVVEKESQKPIIIGKGGSMIKIIGTLARKELLNVYDCNINLKLFVKVEKKWRNNERFLGQAGYKK